MPALVMYIMLRKLISGGFRKTLAVHAPAGLWSQAQVHNVSHICLNVQFKTNCVTMPRLADGSCSAAVAPACTASEPGATASTLWRSWSALAWRWSLPCETTPLERAG